ncbi:probable electron transfer flavoprotein alpha subunit [Fulvimarina pelagi HTCC2506]|uniref:Probable electron transfer flavoprotein alpha subunit n=2 Tax=Fulvimarina pelagi TaxID=217511 RepID=Q0FZC1_9HYPH|nr:electron transfer flavoprotein subunit alpha/FixB family protein [Fulvimarina pelagi]EAU40357.1 probable electron transfer flavoprotein alpha subunit [Fulvimarina pelagi HTCC2506]BAT31394.1 probable electron transfer flavoprotein alpha subunit [Fulvimarina pelagi]
MSRPRRDPRAEREAKTVAVTARRRLDLAAFVSPSRRPRRDPRAELDVIEVFGAPRRRYDRTQTTALVSRMMKRAATQDAEPKAPQVRIVETPAFHVFAVLQTPKGRLSRFDRQILGAARMLADAGSGGGAVVALASAATADLGPAGADRILDLGDEPNRPASLRTEGVKAAVEQLQPKHILLAEDDESADLARRLAVTLGEPIMTDAVYLSAKQVARRKNGMRAEEYGEPPRIITLGEDRAANYSGAPCEARAIEDAPALDLNDPAILSVETIPGDPTQLSLSETDFVVSAGNGVTDIEVFKNLAKVMTATPGASRVICDAGLMPRSAQVGASGTVLSSECYLAFGIAGAPQHLQGIAGCDHVIAVNTDLHAKMVERSGLAIIQDAQLVMPALWQLIEERRGKA